MKIWLACGLVMIVFLSAAFSSCQAPLTVEEEAAVPSAPKRETVVKEKPAPPEDLVVFPVPEGEDPVVVIGGLTVPRWAAGPGAASGKAMSWDEAVKWVSGLNWLGKSDWRLPTCDELKLILENADLLGDIRKAEYWSSDLHPRIPDERAVVVDFTTRTGVPRYRDKGQERFVRAVRPAD